MKKSGSYIQPDENPTVVAVDRDKHSQSAVMWAMDNLLVYNPTIILVHVKNASTAEDVFATFRPIVVRKQSVVAREIALLGTDVSNTLLDYIKTHHVTNIVLGAATRNAITRRFWNHDVPQFINKSAPGYCSVYVIAKGKLQTVRPCLKPASASSPSLSSSFLPAKSNSPEPEDGGRLTIGTPERKTTAAADPMRRPRFINGSSPDNRNEIMSKWSKNAFGDGSESSIRVPRNSSSRSLPEPGVTDPAIKYGVMDLRSDGSSSDQDGWSNSNDVGKLRLEVQQTINQYNNAIKEAASAQERVDGLKQLKLDTTSRLELAKQAEEKALALVELEKEKRRAAMEMTEKAHKLAEHETFRRKYVESRVEQEEEETYRDAEIDVGYRRYSIQEIEAATNNLSKFMKIGEGGYGPVFRGTLDHTPVAIKVLRSDAAEGKQQFHQEVEILSTMRHPNMVLLLGACPEHGCLVYEYMDYGSLEDRLSRKGNTPPIPWPIRFKIAADIATGLLFLHQAKPEPLVHRDLKPANILLDHNYRCKISDVGLARLVPPSVADSVTQYHMTSAAGTFCYIDPEYQQSGKLGTKSDIYSLGVMLLQIITAMPPMGLTHQVERAIERGKLEELLDPSLSNWPLDEAISFAKLALQCTELRKKDRPDLATQIFPELNRLKEFGMNHG